MKIVANHYNGLHWTLPRLLQRLFENVADLDETTTDAPVSAPLDQVSEFAAVDCPARGNVRAGCKAALRAVETKLDRHRPSREQVRQRGNPTPDEGIVGFGRYGDDHARFLRHVSFLSL
jgi:hypothetical protein